MTIDPINSGSTGSQSSVARMSLGDNIDNFLKLLIVQLQHQDPTAPFDTNQMAQQIATLSQVEQQINTNKNLETLVTLMNATQYNSIVNYIGKQIEAPGNAGALEDGHALFAYYLQDNAATVKAVIKDQAGNVVFEGPAPTVRGRNQFDWNGLSTSGQAMPEGTYNIEIEALDASNNAVQSQVFTTGIVTSIDSANGSVYASFGDLSIPIQNITSILAVFEDETNG